MKIVKTIELLIMSTLNVIGLSINCETDFIIIAEP